MKKVICFLFFLIIIFSNSCFFVSAYKTGQDDSGININDIFGSSVLKGDANGDSAVNYDDFDKLKLYLAKEEKEIGKGADLNSDKSVNTTDLAELKGLLASA